MSHINDLIGMARGMRLIAEAGARLQQDNAKLIWVNSSLKALVQSCPTNVVSNFKPNPDVGKDIFNRAMVVAEGLKQYTVMNVPNFNPEPQSQGQMDPQMSEDIEELNREFNRTIESLEKYQLKNEPFNDRLVSPLNEVLAYASQKEATTPEVVQKKDTVQSSIGSTTAVPKEDTVQSSIGSTTAVPKEDTVQSSIGSTTAVPKEDTVQSSIGSTTAVPKPVAKKNIRVKLSDNSKERVVPSSRLGRMFSFGSLAAGLGVGTVAQYARNAIQSMAGKPDDSANAFLSPANAERIVDTLCKVRGAALKLGQLLSIQDETVISPELQRIFERVRQSADFMPAWQVQRVMSEQLGPDWRARLQAFDEKPFAAASIGQVHLAVLHNGTEVAMKVQYPGVAKGINSDIDNLVGVMKVWNMFPKGMFVDNIVEVAKKELSWEVDYIREAQCTKKFKLLLAPYPEYFVPDVIDELCAQEVITTELIDAVPLDKLFDAPYETRYDIAYKIMQLCLREMFVLRCMQTDPNWANFFYNPSTKQVVLLDFGATREYSKEFMDQYIEIIKAASDADRAAILRMSKEMKFLTGYESKLMEETHVDTVMIMGEVFTNTSGEFDFGTQRTTKRIQSLVPTILNHRLCPPPEEIYSLHRKLSGVFLLCSKMKIKMNCRDMFQDIYEQYKSNTLQT